MLLLLCNFSHRKYLILIYFLEAIYFNIYAMEKDREPFYHDSRPAHAKITDKSLIYSLRFD